MGKTSLAGWFHDIPAKTVRKHSTLQRHPQPACKQYARDEVFIHRAGVSYDHGLSFKAIPPSFFEESFSWNTA